MIVIPSFPSLIFSFQFTPFYISYHPYIILRYPFVGILFRLSTGQAGRPWPAGAPGPDLKGRGPGRQVAGPALFGRAKGQLMYELALGSDPGRTRTGPVGEVAICTTTTASPPTPRLTPSITTATTTIPSMDAVTRVHKGGRRKMQDSGHKVCPLFFSFHLQPTTRGIPLVVSLFHSYSTTRGIPLVVGCFIRIRR